MIQFGLRLHDAEQLPMEQLLPLVKEKGFTSAHLALSKAMKEYPCDPSALTRATHCICAICLRKTALTWRCWATI